MSQQFTPPMRALINGLSKQSNNPITLQTQPPGIPSSNYINQSTNLSPQPVGDESPSEEQSSKVFLQSEQNAFQVPSYQPVMSQQQPSIYQQPQPQPQPPIETKNVEPPSQVTPPIDTPTTMNPEIADKKPNKSQDLLTFLNGQSVGRGASQGISASGINYGMAPNRNVGGYNGQGSGYSYGSGY